MRGGGAGLVAAVLALAGCKHSESKPVDKKDPAGLTARPRGVGPAWLDESLAKLPGAGTGVPKAGSSADPRNPGFNTARESRGLLAGRVTDPAGLAAKNVFIQIDAVDGPTDKGAAVGILSDANGYFLVKDLAPGRVYTLSVKETAGGKTLYGVVQTKAPQPNIAIQLREDLALPTPAATPGLPSASLPPAASAPVGDHIPPMGLPRPATPLPSDGSWAPGTGATASPIPATLPGPAGVVPTPAPVPPPSASDPRFAPSPDRTAEGPQPWRPPAASIPGSPPVPAPTFPLPSPGLPPPTGVPPPPGKEKSGRPVKAGADFALVDTLDRPWDFATNRTPLVLLDFMTTTCVPCKKAVPVLADVQARYATQGLQLVGVVCDEVPQRERAERAAKYQRENNLNYALYVEPGPEPGDVRDRFNVQSYPTVVLLGGDGAVLWRGHPGMRVELEAAIRRHLDR